MVPLLGVRVGLSRAHKWGCSRLSLNQIDFVPLTWHSSEFMCSYDSILKKRAVSHSWSDLLVYHSGNIWVRRQNLLWVLNGGCYMFFTFHHLVARWNMLKFFLTDDIFQEFFFIFWGSEIIIEVNFNFITFYETSTSNL